MAGVRLDLFSMSHYSVKYSQFPLASTYLFVKCYEKQLITKSISER